MKALTQIAALGLAWLLSEAALATGMEDLALFKSGGPTQGLWRMELLSSSEPTLNQGAAAMGKMSVCVDVLKQMAKNNQVDEQSCTSKVINNSKDAAEVAVSCNDGSHSQVKLHRESEQSFLIDSERTSKDGKTRAVKARYTYQGACKGDAAIQLDKNSAACQKMGSVDASKMAGMCANAPEQYRAQCEEQMKKMGSMCQ